MSHTRIQSVLDFPASIFNKQLKTSLGTVNYLIRNQSSSVHSLHTLIVDYHQTRKIQSSTEAVKAHDDFKLQISE